MPLTGAFGCPLQITLGLALPPRVMVYPSASVATEIVGPSYWSVERSIFHEPFQGLALSCAIQGRLRATKDARAQRLMPCCFIMMCLRDWILGRFCGGSIRGAYLRRNPRHCQERRPAQFLCVYSSRNTFAGSVVAA